MGGGGGGGTNVAGEPSKSVWFAFNDLAVSK